MTNNKNRFVIKALWSNYFRRMVTMVYLNRIWSIRKVKLSQCLKLFFQISNLSMEYCTISFLLFWERTTLFEPESSIRVYKFTAVVKYTFVRFGVQLLFRFLCHLLIIHDIMLNLTHCIFWMLLVWYGCTHDVDGLYLRKGVDLNKYDC